MKTPEDIAYDVYRVLSARKGFDWWFDDCSDIHQAEIKREIADAIRRGIDPDARPDLRTEPERFDELITELTLRWRPLFDQLEYPSP